MTINCEYCGNAIDKHCEYYMNTGDFNDLRNNVLLCKDCYRKLNILKQVIAYEIKHGDD